MIGPSRAVGPLFKWVCNFAGAILLFGHLSEGADLVAVAAGDGYFPLYRCPLDTLNIELECNLREAIVYLNPENGPDPGYTNIRLKTHDSNGARQPDFIYMWDQTRAMVIDFDLTINTGYPSDRYALIEGYDGPDHVEVGGMASDSILVVIEG